MKEIKRILVTRTGNGASYSTNHYTLSDAEKMYASFWNTRTHVTVQIDYTDGTCEVMDNA